jgi:hypothetical protein
MASDDAASNICQSLSNGEDPEDLATAEVKQHSALLPTRICECNDWVIPVPKNNADADVSVTVLVVAESEAGRSAPAELAFVGRACPFVHNVMFQYTLA